jgi:hypothetical protein
MFPQADNPAVELNQLETLMRLPDAIMEPGILAVLRRYVSDGGNPATVVEMLSDNYHGVPIIQQPFFLGQGTCCGRHVLDSNPVTAVTP